MGYGIVIAVSYLIGSIPNGLMIGKFLRGIDLREHGSKNIGATNAYRVLGWKAALWVFLTDAAKGVVGVLLGSLLTGTPIGMLAGGIAAMTGHNWSLFLKFSGGKGVATGLGVIFVLVPKVTAIVFAVWCVIVYLTRYVSLASIVAAVLVPILMLVFAADTAYLYFGVVAALFVVVRHRANISRLLSGQELKISGK